jgi:hypothetical protein
MLASDQFSCQVFRIHSEYNVFGYDSTGQVATITGLMFGENWCPDQQHIPDSQVAPPRYEPAGRLQNISALTSKSLTTWKFVLHLPHNGYGPLSYQQREGPWALYLRRSQTR